MTFPDEESPKSTFSTFFVLIRQDDPRFKRHYSQTEAFAEAGRLTRLEGKTFFVCRAEFVRAYIHADDPVRIKFESAVRRVYGGAGEYVHPFCPNCRIVRTHSWPTPKRWGRR